MFPKQKVSIEPREGCATDRPTRPPADRRPDDRSPGVTRPVGPSRTDRSARDDLGRRSPADFEPALSPEALTALLERLEILETSLRPIDRLARALARGEFYDLLTHYTSPRRVIALNLLAGITRGLGITLGATIVFALVLLVLRHFVSLPLIGAYIANLLDLIDQHRELVR
ncbi:MAG: hypothetical protein IMX05_00045 [Hydrogenibacillus schlegelii]|nr:hypothetical protein [Hydrogenibacillus schlegelii]